MSTEKKKKIHHPVWSLNNPIYEISVEKGTFVTDSVESGIERDSFKVSLTSENAESNKLQVTVCNKPDYMELLYIRMLRQMV